MIWYSDSMAQEVHRRFAEHMKPFLAEVMPGCEVSHLGVSRNPDTDEVVLRIHLNPMGAVRVVPPILDTDGPNRKLPWRR